MPTTVNGIGTWYYGKRHIHQLPALCSFCKRVGELQSYNTTLYFVVGFIPILPLARKRILEQCPYCRRHRVTSLKKWEAGRSRDIARVADKLSEDPNNRDTVLEALGLATGYQDEVLLNQVAETFLAQHQGDAAVQARLGAAYAYFARGEEAEMAFRLSLAAEDNPEVRRQLAFTLLKQGRPEEAAPYLQHILDERNKEQAGLIYLLVQAYQARGLHQEALALLDRRDAAFPDLAGSKDYKKQRKISEANRESGKPIRPGDLLRDSAKAGYREGGWASRLPRVVLPLILAGFLIWYLSTAVWLGQARRVYLVSGAAKDYTVAVNGREYGVHPGVAVPIRVAEGELVVEPRDANAHFEPVHCRVETPFFSRPFKSRTYVINPDRLAVLMRQEVLYAENPVGANPAPQAFLAEPFYAFEGIDYEFTPFPLNIQIKKNQTVRKTGVDLVGGLSSETRQQLAQQKLDHAQQIKYGKRVVTSEPRDSQGLFFLLAQLEDKEAIDFLRPGLDVRPLLVDWHRMFQDRMQKVNPTEDLQPRYRELAKETANDPDALYLLARVDNEDPDVAEKLLKQATEAAKPSAYAQFARGFTALAQGHFAEACGWAEKAVKQDPQNVSFVQGYERALFAAKKFGELLRYLAAHEAMPGQKVFTLGLELQVYAVQGDEAKARQTIQKIVNLVPGGKGGRERQTLKTTLETTLCCCRKDVKGFLSKRDELPPEMQTGAFEAAVLEGKLQDAAAFVGNEKPEATVRHALLYLAARKAGDHELADKQWERLLGDLLQTRGPLRSLGRTFSGLEPLNTSRLSRAAIDPEQKRVFLAVVVQRFPDSSDVLLPLARQLNFSPDPMSLCLWQLWR